MATEKETFCEFVLSFFSAYKYVKRKVEKESNLENSSGQNFQNETAKIFLVSKLFINIK